VGGEGGPDGDGNPSGPKGSDGNPGTIVGKSGPSAEIPPAIVVQKV
jgi:hypothetical protein